MPLHFWGGRHFTYQTIIENKSLMGKTIQNAWITLNVSATGKFEPILPMSRAVISPFGKKSA